MTDFHTAGRFWLRPFLRPNLIVDERELRDILLATLPAANQRPDLDIAYLTKLTTTGSEM